MFMMKRGEEQGTACCYDGRYKDIKEGNEELANLTENWDKYGTADTSPDLFLHA